MTSFYDHTEIVDDYTVRNRPEAAVRAVHGRPREGFYGIVSPTAFQKYGEASARIQSAAALSSSRSGLPKSHVTVKRNPDYDWGSDMYKHQGPAFLDSVSVRLIPTRRSECYRRDRRGPVRDRLPAGPEGSPQARSQS